MEGSSCSYCPPGLTAICGSVGVTSRETPDMKRNVSWKKIKLTTFSSFLYHVSIKIIESNSIVSRKLADKNTFIWQEQLSYSRSTMMERKLTLTSI